MMMNFKAVIVVLAFAMLSTGCGGGGSGGGSTANCSGAVTELEGGWEFCNTTTGDYISYTFANNCVTVNVKDYTNNDCTGLVTYDESETYTFQLGSDILTTGGQTATQIDVYSTGATQYDIYMIESNILYRGLPTATNNLSSPSTRPDTLNFGIPYTPVL